VHLVGSIQLNTQPAEPGLHGPCKSSVSQHGQELLGSVLPGSSGKKRRLLPHLLKLTGTVTENIIPYTAEGVEFHSLVKTD